MRYEHTFVARNIAHDMKRRYQLCHMIQVGREIRVLALKMEGMPMCDEPERFITTVDPRVGGRYSYIVYQGRRIFAIEHETGAIFGVTRCGKVSHARAYGTLDTLEDWHWGFLKPQRRFQAAARYMINRGPRNY